MDFSGRTKQIGVYLINGRECTRQQFTQKQQEVLNSEEWELSVQDYSTRAIFRLDERKD